MSISFGSLSLAVYHYQNQVFTSFALTCSFFFSQTDPGVTLDFEGDDTFDPDTLPDPMSWDSDDEDGGGSNGDKEELQNRGADEEEELGVDDDESRQSRKKSRCAMNFTAEMYLT